MGWEEEGAYEKPETGCGAGCWTAIVCGRSSIGVEKV